MLTPARFANPGMLASTIWRRSFITSMVTQINRVSLLSCQTVESRMLENSFVYPLMG
jgi:hypothetical protein